MTDQNWEAVIMMQEDIDRTARGVQSEWADIVDDWHDLAADMVSKMVTERTADKVWNLESPSRTKVLRIIARQIASDMRNEYEFFTGNFRYSTGEVRGLLERGALHSVIQDVVNRDGALPPGWMDTSDSWDKIEARRSTAMNADSLDLRNAFPGLDEHHQRILFRKFILRDKLDAAERMGLTRAIDALTQTLNRGFRKAVAEHEGPRRRPPVQVADS